MDLSGICELLTATFTRTLIMTAGVYLGGLLSKQKARVAGNSC